MKKIFWLALFSFMGLGIQQANAQYTTAIGIRGALSPGVSIKHHLAPDNAIEAILVTRWGGVIATGLYEVHFPALGVDNLRWYIGGGGHVGIWSNNNNNPWFDSDGAVVIGLDGIGGLEYTIPDLPINVSIDWKPGFNLVGHTGFWADDGALSIRYVFN